MYIYIFIYKKITNFFFYLIISEEYIRKYFTIPVITLLLLLNFIADMQQ
jgi:hypothetical protein